jgi:thiamine kinase-like enzyme
MYGNKSQDQIQSSSDKNPNRVAGGLKAQGVDHVSMVNEDGSVTEVATKRYVQSLEEQLRKLRAENSVLQKKVSRLDKSQSDLQSFVSNKL